MNRKGFLATLLGLPAALLAAKAVEAITPPAGEPERTPELCPPCGEPIILRSGLPCACPPMFVGFNGPENVFLPICGESGPGCPCEICRTRREFNKRARYRENIG